MALYDNSQTKLWSYHVSSIKLITEDGGTMDLPPIRLKQMQILEDYDHYVMPIFKMIMILEPTAYYAILKNKNKGKIYLRIDKGYRRPNDKEMSCYHEFINDTFDLILDDGTDDLLYSQKELINISDYKTTIKSDMHELKEVANEIEFFLFKTKSIEGIKANNVNVVLSEATIADAIAYLVTKAKINNVIFAQPDNIEKHDVILIPPLSVLKSFQFLDVYYGLYKTGSILYFGIKYVYIIPFNGNCVAYSADENKKTTIVIPRTSNIMHNTTLGELDRGDYSNRYILGDYKTMSVRNESISNNYIVGNDADIMDAYTTKTMVSLSNATTKTTNFLKILENTTENPYVGNMYTAQTRSGSAVISVSAQDVDIECFGPNKEYQVLFEDTKYSEKYKGKYMISKVTHTFNNTGIDLNVNSVCEFRRE